MSVSCENLRKYIFSNTNKEKENKQIYTENIHIIAVMPLFKNKKGNIYQFVEINLFAIYFNTNFIFYLRKSVCVCVRGEEGQLLHLLKFFL